MNISNLNIDGRLIPLEKIIEMTRKGEIQEVTIEIRGKTDHYNSHRYTILSAEIDDSIFIERFWTNQERKNAKKI